LELIGVLVHDGVSTVHKSRDLDELLYPLVDEPKDGVFFGVEGAELEIEAELVVIDTDVDEQQWWFLCFLTGKLGLKELIEGLEIVKNGVGDAIGDTLINKVDVLFPLDGLAVSANLLHGPEVVIMDFLKLLFDFLLLNIVLCVNSLL